MDGAKAAYDRYKAFGVRKRAGASVNAYLILRKGNEVLLQLRKNTGYMDGMWSFVAGHVEDGESSTGGMLREAKEEIGIKVNGLRVVHIMHRKTNRLNVDVFFEAWEWGGSIMNLEPKKCESLAFFPLEELPANMVEYNREALRDALSGRFYSEVGWEKLCPVS